jgi:hypothetical protein
MGSAAVSVRPSTGRVSNVAVVGNYFDTTSFLVGVEVDDSGGVDPVTSLTVTGNVFMKHAPQPPAVMVSPVTLGAGAPVVEGNRWHDRTLPAPGVDGSR